MNSQLFSSDPETRAATCAMEFAKTRVGAGVSGSALVVCTKPL